MRTPPNCSFCSLAACVSAIAIASDENDVSSEKASSLGGASRVKTVKKAGGMRSSSRFCSVSKKLVHLPPALRSGASHVR